MTAPPSLSSVFQIGVDNAMIQVPQNYTVPANPPSEPNPPDSVLVATNTTNTTPKDSVTLYVGAIQGFAHLLTITFFVQALQLFQQIATIVSYTAPNGTFTIPSSSGLLVGDSVTVSSPDGTVSADGVISTVSSSTIIVVYFSDGLPVSLQTAPVVITDNTQGDPNMAPVDSTIAPWVGSIGSTHNDWVTSSSSNFDPVNDGWIGTLPFTLTPNVSNSLNTYVAQNYKTLWINPQGTGGIINPNHPPSYIVTIYATDPITNTYAACNFTLVVGPSFANYGIGVTETLPSAITFVNQNSGSATNILYVASITGFYKGEKIVIGESTPNEEAATIASVNTALLSLALKEPLSYTHLATDQHSVIGDRLFGNSVALPVDDTTSATLFFNFYPFESSIISPSDLNETPSPITITLDTTIESNAVEQDSRMIDLSKSTIYSPILGSDPIGDAIYLTDYTGQIQLPVGLTRDMPLAIPDLWYVKVVLYLNANPENLTQTLFKITGTDGNGVTASAYTVITVLTT